MVSPGGNSQIKGAVGVARFPVTSAGVVPP